MPRRVVPVGIEQRHLIAQQLVVVAKDDFTMIAIHVKLSQAVTSAAKLIADRAQHLDSGQPTSNAMDRFPDIGRENRLPEQLADVM